MWFLTKSHKDDKETIPVEFIECYKCSVMIRKESARFWNHEIFQNGKAGS